MESDGVNIIWFKRDLRVHDHQVLDAASRGKFPCIFIYIIEPSLTHIPESDIRHWSFAWQCFEELRSRLIANAIPIYFFFEEAVTVFSRLIEKYEIKNVLSHQETGMEITYRRDLEIKSLLKRHNIRWTEYCHDGIQRGLKNRDGWEKRWLKYMQSPQLKPNLHDIKGITLDPTLLETMQTSPTDEITEKNSSFQKGGESEAQKLLESFVGSRHKQYLRSIARASQSQEYCSRLSAHIAYGSISARQVYQETKKLLDQDPTNENIRQFHSRIWWRCHYIQKLESDYRIEKEHINRGFQNLEKPFRQDYFEAWSTGQTGFPMIDASMRCLINTGYLNFRMRAMLATFWSFTLWQDWRPGAAHLARVFLDFEPGIHYPQFQMQAGMTGYHPLRIFNPIVQAEKYDDYAQFIKKWIPELSNVPEKIVHKPWELTLMEQNFYKCEIGTDYPKPVVDYLTATQKAKDIYWRWRQRAEVKNRLPEIWERFSLPDDISNYYQEFFSDQKKSVITESKMYTKYPG